MYRTDLGLGTGMASGKIMCNECRMQFNSQHMLNKHKTKFCIGKIGDPHDLRLEYGFRSTSPVRRASPDYDRVSVEMFMYQS